MAKRAQIWLAWLAFSHHHYGGGWFPLPSYPFGMGSHWCCLLRSFLEWIIAWQMKLGHILNRFQLWIQIQMLRIWIRPDRIRVQGKILICIGQNMGQSGRSTHPIPIHSPERRGSFWQVYEMMLYEQAFLTTGLHTSTVSDAIAQKKKKKEQNIHVGCDKREKLSLSYCQQLKFVLSVSQDWLSLVYFWQYWIYWFCIISYYQNSGKALVVGWF